MEKMVAYGWLKIESTYYHGLCYGIRMADGSWDERGRAETEEEAIQKAEELAREKGVEARRFVSARDRAKQFKQEQLAEAEAAPKAQPDLVIEFEEGVVAIPTLGGIIADLPLTKLDRARFPEAVQLPVSKEAAKKRRGWMVVEHQGRGVAMMEHEAQALGLTEAPFWLPDITGARCVPAPGEIDKILAHS